MVGDRKKKSRVMKRYFNARRAWSLAASLLITCRYAQYPELILNTG